MNEKDQTTVTKLHRLAYYIGLYGLPFKQFEHLVKLEKLHNVTFTGAYENKSACRNFIIDIAGYFFQEDVKKKIEVVNFITILCDGSTDKSITEQEIIYVIYVDPDTNLPVMNFFETAASENSQDAPDLKEAIISAFSRDGLDSALKKMVFLSTDGASVNSGSNSGLIRLLQEDYPWLQFVWCFSHRLELSFKDALSEFLKPVGTSLTHLLYIYLNTSKSIRS